MPNIATIRIYKCAIITPITITEQSGKDLTDYAILLKLDSSWDGWDDVADDGSDIVFVDEYNNILFFWMERFDKNNQRAFIWVRIPSIPANGSTRIFMLYGVKKALLTGLQSMHKYAHDPSKVFRFFDNLEVWSGWGTLGNGSVTQACDRKYDGCYSLKKINNCDPHGGYKDLGFTIDRSGWALEYAGFRGSGEGTDCYADRVGLEDANGNGYSFALGHGSSPSLWIDKRSNGSPTELGKTSITDILSEWYIARLILLPDKVIARLFKNDYTLHAETSANDTSYTSFSRVAVRGGRPYYLDVIRLRPYTEPEPSIEIEPSVNGLRYTDLM